MRANELFAFVLVILRWGFLFRYAYERVNQRCNNPVRKRGVGIICPLAYKQGEAMTEDIEALLAAAERVSRVWRQGEAKTKDNLRNAFNELDWTLRYVKEKRGKESTCVIRRDEKPPIIILE